MEKYIICGILLISGFITQITAQTPGEKQIDWEDFGGNDTNDVYPVICQTEPTHFSTYYTFSGRTTNAPTRPSEDKAEYAIVKNLNEGSYTTLFNAWAPGLDDHTFPDDKKKGYMMICNGSASRENDTIYTRPFKTCPNTSMYFRLWVANLLKSTDSQYNPWIRITIDGDVSDVIPYPETDPKYNDSDYWIIPKNNTVWYSIMKSFMNGSSSSLQPSFFDIQPQEAGNDFAVDDIEMTAYLPKIDAQMSGDLCTIGIISITASVTNYIDNNDVTKNFSDGGGAQWLYSKTGKEGTWIKEGTELSLDASFDFTTSKIGFYRLAIGSKESLKIECYDCCALSDVLEITAPNYTTLYWKEVPEDQSWNNVNNWELNDGSNVNYYPNKCTDVHIPGYSSIYPALEDGDACHDIWFHFGGEIAKPHLLDYHYAYVQYNFGTSTGNGDSYSTTPMNRGQWYALAAPLQKIVSGDFSVGGYPNMWQKGFKTTPQHNNPQLPETAEWHAPDSTNSWALNLQYHAIAIWAGDLTTNYYGEGPGYQTNLDALNGVFEIPFFESERAKHHRGFSHINGTSYFQYYYYNIPSLELLPIDDEKYPAGSIARGEESYRFIFEDNNSFRKTTEDGKTVYTMSIPANKEVMIGNPFVSTFDFDAFCNDNLGLIDGNHYRLYANNNFTGYSSVAGGWTQTKDIAPLQAFFIKATGTELRFIPDNISTTNHTNKLRLSSSGNIKDDVIYLNAQNDAGTSWLTLSLQEVEENNLHVLLSKEYPNIPQLYATDHNGQKNSIQFEGRYVNEIPVGILSDSKENVELTIYNKERLAVKELILRDKYLNKDIDLMTQNTYTFKNIPEVSDRFVILFGNKTPAGIDVIEKEEIIQVSTGKNMIHISSLSGSPIRSVEIVNLQGQQLTFLTKLNQVEISVNIPIDQQFIIVKIKSDKESKIEKLFMK